jgi:hypothetical protein
MFPLKALSGALALAPRTPAPPEHPLDFELDAAVEASDSTQRRKEP